MNWKIRLKNPVFWVQVLTGALMIARGMQGGETTMAPDAPAVREIPLDDENDSAA